MSEEVGFFLFGMCMLCLGFFGAQILAETPEPDLVRCEFMVEWCDRADLDSSDFKTANACAWYFGSCDGLQANKGKK